MTFKAVAANDQWTLELDREGIRVYTQIEEPSPYKQIKVTATINAPMEKVLEILMAFSGYKSWMNHVQESYLLNQSDSAYYVFILEDAAWPMQNRYQVSRLDVRQTMSESHIQFRSVPNYIEKRTDAIQIKQFEGYWSIEDRTDHQCSLEFVLIHNPGGYVPPWLANFNAVENPFQSILKLKALAESTRIRP
jgi:ribosome-associated toxin RatA of RatAB toxin-antitoxin module